MAAVGRTKAGPPGGGVPASAAIAYWRVTKPKRLLLAAVAVRAAAVASACKAAMLDPNDR